MDYLILVKHAMPDIDPDEPAREWRLGDEGRRGAFALARRLATYAPSAVITSDEPKAIETGAVVASALDLTPSVEADLHEQRRDTAPFLSERAFEQTMKRFFAQPDTLVFGSETATEAGSRFSRAVQRVSDAHPRGTVVVVAHGTVISLLLADVAGLDPFACWKRLRLPSFVVLERPALTVATIAWNVEDDG